MTIILQFQSFLYLALSLVALGIEVWAFADCARRNPATFEASFKRTKGFWMALTGGSVAGGLFTVLTGAGLGLLGIAAVIAASVYLADVKPAVNDVRRGGQGSW